jgi:hypothetical protein
VETKQPLRPLAAVCLGIHICRQQVAGSLITTIAAVDPRGPAHRSGKLQPGDVLLTIDGTYCGCHLARMHRGRHHEVPSVQPRAALLPFTVFSRRAPMLHYGGPDTVCQAQWAGWATGAHLCSSQRLGAKTGLGLRASLLSPALRAGCAGLPLIKSTRLQISVLLRRPGEDEASPLALKLKERAGLRQSRAGQLSERARRAAMKRAQFLSSSASAEGVARNVVGGGVEHENGSVIEAADAPLSASLQMDHGKWEISAELFAFASPPLPSLSPLSLSPSLSPPPPLHLQLFPAQAPPLAHHDGGPQLQDIRAEQNSIEGTREKIHETQHRQKDSHQPTVNAQRGHLYAAQLPCASASRLDEEQELQRGSKQNQHGIFSLLLTAALAPRHSEQSSERQEAGAPKQVVLSPRRQKRDASNRQSFRRQHSELMAATANAVALSAKHKAMTTLEAQKSRNPNVGPAPLKSGISPSPRALFWDPVLQPPRIERAKEQIHETQHQQKDSHEPTVIAQRCHLPTVIAQRCHLYATQLPRASASRLDEEQELQRGSEHAERPAKVWAIVSVTPSVANTKHLYSSISNSHSPSPVHRRPPSLAGENASKARESGKIWAQMRSRATAQESERAARTIYSVVRPRDSVSHAAGATFAEESCMGADGVGSRACAPGARAPSYFVFS